MARTQGTSANVLSDENVFDDAEYSKPNSITTANWNQPTKRSLASCWDRIAVVTLSGRSLKWEASLFRVIDCDFIYLVPL